MDLIFFMQLYSENLKSNHTLQKTAEIVKNRIVTKKKGMLLLLISELIALKNGDLERT